MKSLPFDWKPAILVGICAFIFLITQFLGGGVEALAGSDDMMRLQQVRDLLAGQGWYDVDQHRMLTPEGGAMHWSRLPDIFLAAIILALTPFLGMASAENAAILIWPMALFGLASAGLLALLRNLGANTSAGVLGILLFFFSSAIYQYWPGRIDHHGFVAALMMVSLACLMGSGRPVLSGVWAGIFAAAMLSIAIESLPFVAGIAAACVALWVFGGQRKRVRMAAFGGAFALSAGVLFILDAPGLGVARNTCDAFGTGHLVAAMTGGVGLLALSFASKWLVTTMTRLGGAVVIAVIVVGVALVVAPQCLGNPYADLSPDVRANWLSTIGEARSIGVAFSQDPAQAITHFGFIFAGLLAGSVAVFKAPVHTRLRWTLMLVLLIGAAGLTSWQARGAVFAHLLASVPVAWLVGVMLDNYRREGGVPHLLRLAIAAILLLPLGWKVLGGYVADSVAEGHVTEQVDCRNAAALDMLSAYPPARVFAPIDIGPAILVSTPHNVFAGPYHRNPKGIAKTIEAFVGPLSSAEQIIKSAEADYLLFCVGAPETDRYARYAVEGLAANLNVNNSPEWLVAVEIFDEMETGLRLYRVLK